jgi:hypothetical protein
MPDILNSLIQRPRLATSCFIRWPTVPMAGATMTSTRSRTCATH